MFWPYRGMRLLKSTLKKKLETVLERPANSQVPRARSLTRCVILYLCIVEGPRSHRTIANGLGAQGLWAISVSSYFDFSIWSCQKLRNWSFVLEIAPLVPFVSIAFAMFDCRIWLHLCQKHSEQISAGGGNQARSIVIPKDWYKKSCPSHVLL